MKGKELKKEFEDKRVDFVLTQFESLGGHIDTLISSSTMRIYSFLFLYTIGASVVSILIDRLGNLALKLSITCGCFVMLVIGIYIIVRQIQASAHITVYFRILNRIRKKFVGDNQEFSKLFGPLLSISDKEPKSIGNIFDPGLILIELLNSITLSTLVWVWIDKLTLKIVCISKQLPIIIILVIITSFCLQFFLFKQRAKKSLTDLEKR